VPGPWITKWTDIIIKYKALTGQRAFYVQSLHEEFGMLDDTLITAICARKLLTWELLGPVVRLGPEEVDVTDIQAVKEIHSVKSGYPKSDWYQRLVPEMTNVFNTNDVEFHRRHRRLLAGPLSESSLKSVEPIVRGKVELAIRKIDEEMASRGAADLFKWSLFFATDVIGELTFGESFRMLDIGKVCSLGLDPWLLC
jgi:cytochrome P450